MPVSQGLTREIRRQTPPMPLYVDNLALTGSGAAETVTVPAGATHCLFSPYPKTADFLVCRSGTAARPSGDVTDGTASLPNPLILGVSAGTTFSIVAGTADVSVAIAFYNAEGI